MTTKTAGVLGAVTLLAGAGAAQAMPAEPDLARVMSPVSYAELLQPIPNAAELLSASDAQAAQLPLAREGEGAVQDVQFYYHHHHHHHHHFRGPFFHHHHHGYYRRFYHHHHHHHHHHFYRDYY